MQAVGIFTYCTTMEQFLEKVRTYADALGIQPSTVVQRAAKLGGAVWAKWEAGHASPTLRTADRILKYIEENPAPAAVADAVEPMKEAI